MENKFKIIVNLDTDKQNPEMRITHDLPNWEIVAEILNNAALKIKNEIAIQRLIKEPIINKPNCN